MKVVSHSRRQGWLTLNGVNTTRSLSSTSGTGKQKLNSSVGFSLGDMMDIND